jgi:tetratricopeptide (TPR) repeat protein
MKSREQQAAEQALHRRLAPIQDAFYDQKNYKGVVKTCEAALKKNPDQVWVKTYLGMANQCLGNTEVAISIFESVVKMVKPTDVDFVVRALKQALEQAEQIPLYIQALEKITQSTSVAEDVMKAQVSLFHFYFRAGEFQKASKQATKLKMLTKDKNPKHDYMMWNIVATFWNYKANPETQAMSLMLCERMLGKLAAEGKLVGGEGVGFYCDVLRASAKIEEARKVAEGELGSQGFPFEEERLKFICKILVESKDREAAFACFEKILNESADDWDAWEGLIDSTDDKAKVAGIVSDKMETHPLKRGPRLAGIEIVAREKNEAELGNLLVKYFESFGHKACFWGDIARYALMLKAPERARVVKEMAAQLQEVDWETDLPLRDFSARELESESDPHREERDGRDSGKVDQWSKEDQQRQNQIMRRVAVSKLEMTLELRDSDGKLCQELFQQFNAACKLYRKNLKVTEEGPNDENLIIAAHRLKAMDKPLDAASVCLAGLEHTPHSFQPKLFLIGLATEIGAYSYAAEMYKDLDLKYVQNDSMGHYALYPAIQGGDHGWVEEICKHMQEFRDNSLKRSVPNDTTKCFSHGKWTQLEGFAQFGNRLQGSWHFVACQLETVLSEIFSKATEDPKTLVDAARKRGMVTGGPRRGMNWIESVVEECETYKGKEDLRLVYNYDLRVQTNFTSCQTKAEYSAAEWVVPQAKLDWLKGRALLVSILEATSKHDAEGVVALVEKYLKIDRASQKVVGASDLMLDAVEAVLKSTASLASCGVEHFAQASTELRAFIKSVGTLEADLKSKMEGNDVPSLVPGWASDVSFGAFQLVPLAFNLSQSWRKFGQPTKSAQKKLSPELKAAFTEMLSAIKDAVKSVSEFTGFLTELSKSRRSNSDAALKGWAVQHSVMEGANAQHLDAAAHSIATSWNAFFVHVFTKASYWQNQLKQ